MSTELTSLIARLNTPCRRALENAAGLCVAQTHYNVEVEHLLVKLLDETGTDLERILRYYEIEPSKVLSQLQESLDRFDRGNHRTPAMSVQVPLLLREAWVITSLRLGEGAVRSGALLAALFANDLLRATVGGSCPVLAKISREALAEDLPELIQGSSEDGLGGTPRSEGSAESGTVPPASTKALDRYTVDLTEEARSGRIDPIRGRDSEIRMVIDILTRRRQNNPILVGDAGVGKTAVVEGFALRVASGQVPKSLEQLSVRILDLGALQAGAGVRGEFEERLKSVIREVEESAIPVVLFIDEAHTLIGAGGAAGQGDAANLLKPALARGELRTIAATTWAEYKRYVEKDPALARRFQLIRVEEPEEEAALDMLRGIARNLERHHGILILDEALRDAVRLSDRYISERRLPDKAISVLDTACARVALAQEGKPAVLEDVEARQQRLELEMEILQREQARGEDHGPAVEELEGQLEAVSKERADLEAWWRREKELVGKVRNLQLSAEKASAEGAASLTDGLPEELAELREELATLQGNEPMVPACVDSRVVASVVSGWTGIPVGRMLKDEVEAVLSLEDRLAQRIVGQSQALDAIGRRIRTSRAGLEDPARPKGVFLLVGPTGVGKTETALALADQLYGGERTLETVNLSEFQEAHSMATLKGSPPGYVGYGTGGVLTEAVRRRPYSVVLLDEAEKAHPDVLELFYQVFDKGILEDGEGVPVDFKNTVILLTSNAGGEVIQRLAAQEPEVSGEALMESVNVSLRKHFRPAFLGRLVVVPFFPLKEADIRRIVRLKLDQVRDRILRNHRSVLTYDEGLVASIAERCDAAESGARQVDSILTQTLLPELSGRILDRMAQGQDFSKVHISVDEMGRFV